MRHQHDPCARITRGLDGRQRRADTRITRYFSVPQGYVEVFSNQHPLTCERQFRHFLDRHEKVLVSE